MAALQSNPLKCYNSHNLLGGGQYEPPVSKEEPTMRFNCILRVVALTLVVCAFALVLSTCGGGKQSSVASLQSSDRSGGLQAADYPADNPPVEVSLDSALVELDALETPDGVDAELFAELNDALREALDQRFSSLTPNPSSLTPAKLVSTPPTGEANRVNDLQITDNGGGTYTLSWHYRNLGDYDQSGTVGISDITPIAMHYGETYDPETEPNCLLAVIDGNGDGKVGIADITPIAMYYSTDCAGYSIRGSSTYPESLDETVEIGTVEIALATGEGRKRFSELLPESEYQFFAVAPYDGDSSLGDLSNVVILEMTDWHTGTVDSVDDVGEWTSLAVVNGNPAISYRDDTNQDLKYVRASDASGSSWGSPVTVDSAGNVGLFNSLAVVNGNPAISYYDGTNMSLKYVRASDSSGESWGTPVAADSVVVVGPITSLAVVNGNPAISYLDWGNTALMYVRADDANGESWGAPVTVDGAGDDVGWYASLAVVSSNPAISYWDGTNQDLKYVRANDASGSDWTTIPPVTVDSAGLVGEWTSLAVANGNPAISYFDYTNNDLKYVRASDAGGIIWGTPVTVDGAGDDVGWCTSMVVVNGNPAISYYGNTDLKYVRASDASGGSWDASVAVDSEGIVGEYTSLAVVNGNPAISYYSSTNADLKFAIYY